jgi:YfiH family protein
MTQTIGTMTTAATGNDLKILQFPTLSKERRIIHFMTTRHGGVSTGPYASLNLGEYGGDDPAAVRRNRERLCALLGISPANLCVPRQVHGDKAALIESPAGLTGGTDALITGEKGVCIAVSTADCASIVLYAPDRDVIAAIHAGWRGTVQHIVTKTIRRMTRELSCDPGRMLAGIGPSIGAQAFEVGEEVYEAFAAAGMDMRAIGQRNPSPGKAFIDLKEANRRQLIDAGLAEAHIEVSGVCTFTSHNDFFSARRLGTDSGRMLTGIMIKNT